PSDCGRVRAGNADHRSLRRTRRDPRRGGHRLRRKASRGGQRSARHAHRRPGADQRAALRHTGPGRTVAGPDRRWPAPGRAGALMIIDAHHHLWDPAVRDYPWMSGAALAPIRRAYTVDDLRAACAGVTRTVLVQTVSSTDETAEFLATAEK